MLSEVKQPTDTLLSSFNESIWKQFGATIDMFENAIVMCPEEFWGKPQFWYKAFHASFWLDYYLTTNPDGFTPSSPFTTSEFDKSGKLPERKYTKDEVLTYVRASKKKLHAVMKNMNEEVALGRWINPDRDFSFFEMLLYNMRHLQHHTAQLNLLLRQGITDAPGWIAQTEGSIQ